MRESIGTVSLLNFIIFFIFLVFAFLAGTLSYYKAFRVNNSIVSAIEKYEGYNKYSKEEIEQKLSSFGYERVDFNCPIVGTTDKYYLLDSNGAAALDSASRGYQGYCIYAYDHDTIDGKATDQYDSYEVVTIITFNFPVVQDLIKLRVSAKTDRIYNFEASGAALNALAPSGS